MTPVRHDATASIRLSQDSLALIAITAARKGFKVGEYLRAAVLEKLERDNSTGK